MYLYLKVVLHSGTSRMPLRWPELESREVTVDSGDKRPPTVPLESMLWLNITHPVRYMWRVRIR